MPSVHFDVDDAVCTITIDRPDVRNAIDGPTASELLAAFMQFENDDSLSVAVLTGASDTFCSGADLTSLEDPDRAPRLDETGPGPLGPTRMSLSKPLIAAIGGHAVAGGLELALLADLRIAEEDAVLGVLNRRWGIPLIDGGTVRLPRIIGHGRAMDLILTGRPVNADEALSMGLVNRVVPLGRSLQVAHDIAEQIASFPQECLRADRRSALEQWDLPMREALRVEATMAAGLLAEEGLEGARRFMAGEGRHGSF